jgi:hypothetical protein
MITAHINALGQRAVCYGCLHPSLRVWQLHEGKCAVSAVCLHFLVSLPPILGEQLIVLYNEIVGYFLYRPVHRNIS